jgi:hypothetical protein
VRAEGSPALFFEALPIQNKKKNGYVPFTHQLFNAGWGYAWVGDTTAPEGWFDDYDHSVPEEGEIRTTHHANIGNIPPPVFTFVQGHMGSFCEDDISTLLAVGVNREDINPLLRDLQKIAVAHLHSCIATFYRNVRRAPHVQVTQSVAHGAPHLAGSQEGVG